MERKALLYLDSDLVKRAKKENIDISRLTEEALKEALEVAIPPTAATIYK
jgi:post-segregation antitoxin (ccd killing protein)